LASVAAKLDPNRADVFDTLAAAYAETGNYIDAIAMQEKAIELRPQDATFRAHLELYKSQKPLRSDSPTEANRTVPAPNDGAAQKKPVELSFIVAKHGLIHDNQIIEWADVEKLITAEPNTKLVHPIFKFTLSGSEKHQEDLRAKIWDFRKRVPLHGHTWGSVAPDDYAKFDAIEKTAATPAADGTQPESKLKIGRQQILVLDSSGKPIPGVVVRPEQMSAANDLNVEWAKVTDADGRATVHYPQAMLERYGMPSMLCSFTHREYVSKHDTVKFSPREFVVKLIRGGHVKISATADDGWNIGELYALCDKSNPQFTWSRPAANAGGAGDPVAAGPTIRSPPLPAGRALVRAVAFRPDGATLFSNPRPVQIKTGEVQKIEAELRPGFTLEGALSDNVPRPVRNGRVLLSINADFGIGWSDWTTIRDDGTFTFQSLPPDSGSKALIVAVCDGFVSTSPTSAEFKDIGMTVPQSFPIAPKGTSAVVEMQPAGRLTVKVQDPAGNPLAGVRVQANANYLVARNGTTSLGSLGGAREMLREGANYQPKSDLDAFPYQGTSNDNGIIELTNLPPYATYLTAASDDYELPRNPAYFPMAVPIAQTEVKSGETTKLNLTLVPIERKEKAAAQNAGVRDDAQPLAPAAAQELPDLRN
jgi:hypothetical protein